MGKALSWRSRARGSEFSPDPPTGGDFGPGQGRRRCGGGEITGNAGPFATGPFISRIVFPCGCPTPDDGLDRLWLRYANLRAVSEGCPEVVLPRLAASDRNLAAILAEILS